MEARFGTVNRSRSRTQSSSPSENSGNLRGGGERGGRRRSGRSSSSSKQGNVFQREWQLCRQTVWTAGSKYNILVSSFLGFVISLIILVAFRPIFVMTKVADSPIAESESLVHPPLQDIRETVCEYKLSMGSILLWSALAGGSVAILTYFTCRKPSDTSASYAPSIISPPPLN